MKSQGTSKAGEMDWEGGLKEMIENNLWGLVCDKCTGGGRDYDEGDKCEQCHGNGVYDWRVEPLVSEVKKIIQQAIAQERERTKQVVRQAQIAMEYIEDDEQADWCLARFNAMLDEDLKLDFITNDRE